MSLVDLLQAACGTLISTAALDAVTTYDRRGTSVDTIGMDARQPGSTVDAPDSSATDHTAMHIGELCDGWA